MFRLRLTDEPPSPAQRLTWAAARALGWSPFDPRLQGLSILQMEWALLMADPDMREEARNNRLQERDKAAVMLVEWFRDHVTGG